MTLGYSLYDLGLVLEPIALQLCPLYQVPLARHRVVTCWPVCLAPSRPSLHILFAIRCGCTWLCAGCLARMTMTKQRQAPPLSDKVKIVHCVDCGKKVGRSHRLRHAKKCVKYNFEKQSCYRGRSLRTAKHGRQAHLEKVYYKVEKALYQWSSDIHARNLPVSGLSLRSEARDFAFVLKTENFVAGSGRLRRF